MTASHKFGSIQKEVNCGIKEFKFLEFAYRNLAVFTRNLTIFNRKVTGSQQEVNRNFKFLQTKFWKMHP